MHPSIQLKKRTLVLALFLYCLAVCSALQAVTPAPDGGYPGNNTAEGTNALQSLTTGVWNTALGYQTLYHNKTGNFNTADGFKALFSNTTGAQNTSTGVNALLSNTTGGFNTANGVNALRSNTTGNYNTADGVNALYKNTIGRFNTAIGHQALFSNTNGTSNNAIGDSALYRNIHGGDNTAVGDLALENNDSTGHGTANSNTAVGASALFSNTDGDSNNAVGFSALGSNTVGLFNQAMGFRALGANLNGSSNVAIGDSAFSGNVHGSFNTVVGYQAGLTAEGSDNVYIGATAADGVNSESGTIRIGDPSFVSACYIAGIAGQTVGAGGTTCYVDNAGKLGVFLSARRYKENIQSMDDTSAVLLSLKPVTFRYKPEFDKSGTKQFGLIAEQVAEVSPDLVTHDAKGELSTVRYEAINAMLLNEFLKEHRKNEDQEATIAQQQKRIDMLTARVDEQALQIEKVSARLAAASPSGGGLEPNRPAPQTAFNNQ